MQMEIGWSCVLWVEFLKGDLSLFVLDFLSFWGLFGHTDTENGGVEDKNQSVSVRNFYPKYFLLLI